MTGLAYFTKGEKGKKSLDFLGLSFVTIVSINRFRRTLNLPPLRNVFGGWMHSPQLNLGLFPEWFAQPQRDWSPATRLTGFVLYDKQNGEENLPKELESFLSAGDPPIVFTAGTAMKHADRFFRDCVEACQLLGRRGILLTAHPEQLPADLPQGIRHFAYVPFCTAPARDKKTPDGYYNIERMVKSLAARGKVAA